MRNQTESPHVHDFHFRMLSRVKFKKGIGWKLGRLFDSKKGFRTALLTSALKDGISSKGGKAAALTESQLGSLGEALITANYSQKQEREALVLCQGFAIPSAVARSSMRLIRVSRSGWVENNWDTK